MSEYKRLTENEFDCSRCKDRKCTIPDAYCCDRLRCEIYNRLADLEDKIENGTLVELPCKVGDTVYWVMDMNILTYKVKGFSYNCNDDMGLRLILQEIEPSVSFYLGKRLFFTKTEAEARLKELQEKQK